MSVCRNCQTKFHYNVTCCGFELPCELKFCKEKCMEDYFNENEPSAEYLASIVYELEDGTPHQLYKYIEEKKIAMGTFIIDKLLSGDYFTHRDYE